MSPDDGHDDPRRAQAKATQRPRYAPSPAAAATSAPVVPATMAPDRQAMYALENARSVWKVAFEPMLIPGIRYEWYSRPRLFGSSFSSQVGW